MRPICRACCSTWRNGARPIRTSSRSSIRRLAPALTEARALLTEIGAIDGERRITDEGKKLRKLPLPPRLARMVVDAAAEGAGQRAADIAAILSERGLGGSDADLGHRFDQFRRDRSRRGEDARRMAKRWAEDAGASADTTEPSPGALLALAYPDRIAKSRGGNGAFLLANGRGANVDMASPLAREPFLAVAELAGTAAQSRILLAASITLGEIEQRFADQIERREDIVVRRRIGKPARPGERAARRHHAQRAAVRGDAGPGGGEAARRRHRPARTRPAAVDQLAAAMARPRHVPPPCRRRYVAGLFRHRPRRPAPPTGWCRS